MSRILITGGAGFIGSSLVSALSSSEHNQLVVFDNLSKRNKENINRWFQNSNSIFIENDMLDISGLQKAVDISDVVFHLAANPTVALGAFDTRIDYDQNLVATYNLLEAMRKSKSCKKIFFTSTSTVYGEADTIPTPETYAPLKPISLYGATKLACEAMISGYCHSFNMSGIVFRLANIIGPKNKHGVIYDFVTKLTANPKCLDILGNGNQNKSYLYIEDCIDAILTVASKNDNRVFDILNVGSNDMVKVLDIASIVISELSLKDVDIRFIDEFNGAGWKGDVREFLLDCSKLETLGCKPKYNSREAVIITASQYAKRRVQ